MKEYIPQGRLPQKNNPWKRNNIFKQAKRSGSLIKWQKYKIARNKVTSMLHNLLQKVEP